MNNITKVLALAVFILIFPSSVFADSNTGTQDKLIGSAFKVLARGFVAVTDMDKLKEENARKIEKMDEGKFHKRYAKIYKVIKGLPLAVRSTYGISENMSKEDAIMNIKLMDKDKAYEVIDAVPDKLIADEFRAYLRNKKEQVKNSNIVVQINGFWNSMFKAKKKTR